MWIPSRVLSVFVFSVAWAAHAQTPTPPSAAGAEAGSPGLGAIIETDARVVRIVSGRRFTEGPLWAAGQNLGAEGLLFTDIPADTVYLWKPGSGSALVESEAEIYEQPSGKANGLALTRVRSRVPAQVSQPGYRPGLILAQHDGRLSIKGRLDRPAPFAEKFEGKALNSPNDIAVHSGGSIYFTDPPYGVGKRTRELDFSGVYRLGKDGTLTLLVRDLPTPNGLAFSPDERVLYLADSSRGELYAFDVNADGSLGERRLFALLTRPRESGGPGSSDAQPKPRSASPDGVKVDDRGNVYCAAFGGVWVFSADGTKLGVIETPEQPSNLCFGFSGEPARPTLFITARSSVYAVPVRIGQAAPGGYGQGAPSTP